MQMLSFQYDIFSSWTPNIITSSGTNGTTTANICNNYYRRHIIAWSYTAAELQAAFNATSKSISGLRFFVTTQPTYQPYPQYAIGMKNGTFSGNNPGNTGYTVVKLPSDESFTTSTDKVFQPFDTPFLWSGDDLAIVVAWGQSPTNYSSTGTNPIGAGNIYYSRTDSAGTYVINTDTIGSTVAGRPVIQLYS